MLGIRVWNTLRRAKEEFVPREPGRVAIYVCGLTPYDHAHLGHLRPAVVWDVIRNYLEYRGLRVTLVQNFTDVDDKVIDRSRRSGVEPARLSSTFIREYLRALDRLGVSPADAYPLVTRHIPEIVEMIERLVERAHAYAVDGTVYFDVTSFPGYGKLSGQRAEALEAGARVEPDERKRHPADFALWKAAKPGEPSWPSPWGPGRPGWHIECSAMSLKYLGFGFDFHGGGTDLIFPHHENEVAQSEACEGHEGFVRYWLHHGLVNVQAEKMSKSLGNFTIADEILSRYPAALVKFYLLSTHYRSVLEYHPASLEQAQPGWQRLQQAYGRLAPFAPFLEGLGRQPPERWLDDQLMLLGAPTAGDDAQRRAMQAVKNVRQSFESAMDDDFNTPEAMGALFDLVRDVNPLIERTPVRREVSVIEHDDVHDPATAVPRRILSAAFALMRQLAGGILGVVGTPAEAGAAPRSEGETSEKGSERLAARLIGLVLDLRERARKERRFDEADALRGELEAAGVSVEDTPAGPRWHVAGGRDG